MEPDWRKQLSELSDDLLSDMYCNTVDVDEIWGRIGQILRGEPSPRWLRKKFGEK